MDIFDRLRDDHETIGALIDALREHRDDALVSRLRTELTAHLAAEELVLYQQMSDEPGARAAVDEGIRLHHEARGRMSDVFQAPDDGDWPAVVGRLGEIVADHVRVEEEQVYPAAHRSLATDEKDLLVRRYDESRADYAA